MFIFAENKSIRSSSKITRMQRLCHAIQQGKHIGFFFLFWSVLFNPIRAGLTLLAEPEALGI